MSNDLDVEGGNSRRVRGDACESDRFRETRKYMYIGVRESDKVPLKFLLVSMKVSRNKKYLKVLSCT